MRLGRDADDGEAMVVGVVADVRQRSLAEPPLPMYYVPVTQAPWALSLYVVARVDASGGTGAALVPELRAALRALDPSIALTDVVIGNALIARTVAGPRFRAVALLLFGAFALVLVFAGVYGLISLGVDERRQEIGLRMALGADRRRVMRLVVTQGLAVMGAGLALGAAGALGMGRVLGTLLYGVTPMDAATLGGVTIVLAGVALAASWFPARRAAALDPLITLKGE